MTAAKEWECGECGYIHREIKAPRRCPHCGAPSDAFEAYEYDEEEEVGGNDAECPECGAWFDLPKGIAVGKRVKCPECETVLEVVELEPPVLDYAFAEEDEE